MNAADIVALTRDNNNWGGGNIVTLLLIFALMGGGFGWNRGDFGQFASAASQTEILLGQQFQNLDNKVDRIGNGIADAAYALKNASDDVKSTALVSRYELGSQLADCCCTTNRNIDQVRYDMSLGFCGVKETVNSDMQKILDKLCAMETGNVRDENLQLKLQMALCGIPKVNPYGYGIVPNFAPPYTMPQYFGGTTF